jgi:3-deoxy-7-phosphoheptulonate synthase
MVCRYTDVVQVGARNMQNFPLLKELGSCGKPVLLKRGMGATVEEWLSSAEYVLLGGNADVILCERGVRSFDPARPVVPDIAAVPLAKRISHLPVIFDPSHSTGRSEEVSAAACAAVAAGADGLIVEVHCEPAAARSDAEQTLSPEQFAEMMKRVGKVAAALERSI